MDEAAFQAFLQGAQGGANPDDILGFQKNIMASNPYRMAAAPILGTRFDTSSWSPGTALAATAAQSFLGSVLQGLGQRKEAQQMEAVAQALPSLYADPLKAQVPQGVEADAFNALRGNVYSRQAKSKSEMREQLVKDMLGVDIAGKTEEAKELGKLNAKKKAYGASMEEDPESPVAKEIDAAAADISKLPAVTQLNTTQTTLARIKSLGGLNTSTSDIPFITLFIGGLDGSVVKEGEYARVGGTSPLLKKYQKIIESRLNGGSEIGVAIKKQMYEELQNSQKGLLDEAFRQATPRMQRAKRRGVSDPLQVLPFNTEMDFSNPFENTIDTEGLKREALELKAKNPTLGQTDIANMLRNTYQK